MPLPGGGVREERADEDTRGASPPATPAESEVEYSASSGGGGSPRGAEEEILEPTSARVSRLGPPSGEPRAPPQRQEPAPAASAAAASAMGTDRFEYNVPPEGQLHSGKVNQVGAMAALQEYNTYQRSHGRPELRIPDNIEHARKDTAKKATGISHHLH